MGSLTVVTGTSQSQLGGRESGPKSLTHCCLERLGSRSEVERLIDLAGLGDQVTVEVDDGHRSVMDGFRNARADLLSQHP